MIQARGKTLASALSPAAVFIFALCYLPFSALQLSVALQLPRLFASHLGVSLAAVGAVFGFVRLIDIPVDPVLGVWMDRTQSRIGRHRLWMLLSAPILMLSIWGLYQAPNGVGQLYLIGFLLVMYVGMSMLLLSANAWAAALATSYAARSHIFGAMATVGVAGALMVPIVPIIVAGQGGDEADGVRAVGWAMLIVTPLILVLSAVLTPERMEAQTVERHRATAKEYLALMARPNVIRLLASDLFVTLGPGWVASLYLFFFKDAREFTTTQSNLLLMIYFAAGLAGAPATAWLANRIGKHRALLATTTSYSATLCLVFVLPKGHFELTAPAMALGGALAAGFLVMVRALTADVADEIELETGRKQIGLLYALTSATTKLASAFAIVLTFQVLAAIGYDPKEGAVNTPAQMQGLQLAFVSGPIVFVLLGGACFLGYRLTAARHAEIRQALDARAAEAAP